MIPQAEFYKALKTAAAFIDPGLPGLHVVHFNFITSDNFEMVATDGHRLVTIEFSAPHSCPPGTRISIPLQMVEDILERFPEDIETDITLASWDSNLLITNGVESREVRGPKPEEYPNYASAIADVSPVPAICGVNPKLLTSIIKNCAPLMASKKAEDPRIEIGVSSGEVPLLIKFKLAPGIEAIKSLTAHLMPLWRAEDMRRVYVWPDFSWMNADDYEDVVEAWRGDDYKEVTVSPYVTDEEMPRRLSECFK